MPDDVIGVTVSSSQSGDIFYVDDLFFPSHKRRTKRIQRKASPWHSSRTSMWAPRPSSRRNGTRWSHGFP